MSGALAVLSFLIGCFCLGVLIGVALVAFCAVFALIDWLGDRGVGRD